MIHSAQLQTKMRANLVDQLPNSAQLSACVTLWLISSASTTSSRPCPSSHTSKRVSPTTKWKPYNRRGNKASHQKGLKRRRLQYRITGNCQWKSEHCRRLWKIAGPSCSDRPISRHMRRRCCRKWQLLIICEIEQVLRSRWSRHNHPIHRRQLPTLRCLNLWTVLEGILLINNIRESVFKIRQLMGSQRRIRTQRASYRTWSRSMQT